VGSADTTDTRVLSSFESPIPRRILVERTPGNPREVAIV
jgi:hypothetical protein